jgi:hypothetical protein
LKVVQLEGCNGVFGCVYRENGGQCGGKERRDHGEITPTGNDSRREMDPVSVKSRASLYRNAIRFAVIRVIVDKPSGRMGRFI